MPPQCSKLTSENELLREQLSYLRTFLTNAVSFTLPQQSVSLPSTTPQQQAAASAQVTSALAKSGGTGSESAHGDIKHEPSSL